MIKNIKSIFEGLMNFLKLKLIWNHPTSNFIFFQDFFFCERMLNKLGYTFLVHSQNFLSKWARLNGILNRIANIILQLALIASIILSIQDGQIYVVLENILVTGPFIVAFIKFYILLYKNIEKILEIVEKLDEHFPHSGNEQLKYKTSSYLRNSKYMYLIYNTMYYVLYIQFSSIPIVFQFYAAYMSIDLKWEAILTTNLGFDQLQPVVYEIVFIFEAWFLYFFACFVLGTDLLYANLIQILVMEFDNLGQVFGEINFDDGDKEAIKELKKLVNIHQELIEVAEKLEDIFSPILLMNSFASITALCTASFLSVVNTKLIIRRTARNNFFLF